MAWLSGWSYRKEISITGQSGAGTDYQVKLEIGDSAGGDFHLEGHCTNFPQDITVTDDDGTTLLKYKIDDITADPIKMWVKVADDLGSNQTIRVYYGKNGETSNNDEDTFLDFYSFENTLDGYSAGSTSTSQSLDGSYSYLPPIGSYGSRTTDVYTRPYIWEISYFIPTGQTGGLLDSSYCFSNTKSINMNLGHPTALKWGYYASAAWQDSSIQPTHNTWHTLKIIVNSNDTFSVYSDTDTIIENTESGNPLGSTIIRWYRYSGKTIYFDSERTRKYNSPEPAFSSAGSEETPPAGVSPTAVFYGPLVGPLGGPI